MSAGNPANDGSSRPDLRRVACNPDYWYPVAQSRRLKRNKTPGGVFAGEPIVLVRTDSGKVFALEDRCAHRQFPLSKGAVCGEQSQCGYHAGRYDPTGEITSIPYLVTGVRPPRRVRAYPCREAFGLVFVFPGDSALAEQTVFPELPWFGSADYKVMAFERDVACHYTFMHENLMDMNHQFLHRRLMGRRQPRLLGKTHGGATWLPLGGRGNETNSEIMTTPREYPYQTRKIAGPKTGAVPSLA